MAKRRTLDAHKPTPPMQKPGAQESPIVAALEGEMQSKGPAASAPVRRKTAKLPGAGGGGFPGKI